MRKQQVYLWGILAAALCIRLVAMVALPLMDTTEARYGEMARLMSETGNWLTPQFDYGVPFWGKPPLFTWMSAAGIEWFGLSEFAVRFPHWLAGIFVMAVMALFARKLGFNALRTSVVMATCGIFLLSKGAVMTDMVLTVGMVLAMTGFYLCWKGEEFWGYVGFIGLAIGLLSKGPLILVLVGLTVLPWLVIQHGLKQAFMVLWHRFPLLTGSLLMLVIALPWYLMAEQATPGFLDYFIVGEHFKRFVVSGWEGDLYGTAHEEVRGTIWWFWLYSAAPWSIVLPVLLWRQRHSLLLRARGNDGVLSFLLLWLVSPMVLFTGAGNILQAYVLPGIPALALLISMLLPEKIMAPRWFRLVCCIAPMLMLGYTIAMINGGSDRKSDAVIFQQADNSVPSFYVGKRPFSGQFYSLGQARVLTDNASLQTMDDFQLIGESLQVQRLIVGLDHACEQRFITVKQRALYRCFKDS
ncbi:ArnT family glycosyltransferase [Endozoicomonas elysicola]|uniref:Dolichyl-phosphate-mannose-protein mannosyltransferase n=1 Tax=Endozoicomonas elysicola TaxID=305900 RepID=A0A081KE75_9GAMM|nr:glycosyltransferase family 39 protein [Endozoicomonas elysicola]KEI72451.1 dolichyl-phosphate-mannose-protein mannosyltransferase [Endozoicomonas elysicola]